jgi:hypothetical protein
MEKEDKQLKEVLREGHQHDSPSFSFTANVMRSVEAKRAEKLKPIIGKWGWLFIATFFIAILATPIVAGAVRQFDFSELSIPHLPLISAIILMSGVFILFDELYLRKRRTRS